MTARKTPGKRQRQTHIVAVLEEAFAGLMVADPVAFRSKFRKMAADPGSFCRGSACLFYADMAATKDRWADDRTSRIWIQGDLHAENFGTYMDGEGVLVFDVNDFDEAYLGHFTWDVRRMAASIAMMGWQKALPDDVIADLIEVYVTSYVDKIRDFVETDRDNTFSLGLHWQRRIAGVQLPDRRLDPGVGERHRPVDEAASPTRTATTRSWSSRPRKQSPR